MPLSILRAARYRGQQSADLPGSATFGVGSQAMTDNDPQPQTSSIEPGVPGEVEGDVEV